MSEEKICLGDVLVAKKRIGKYIANTPLVKSSWLSNLTGADVYMKLENVQVTGSFKYRGALNALFWAKENHINKVFTASAGNHGLGVAEASVHTEVQATVCVPQTASPLKKQKLQSYSISLIQHGDECDVTEAYARRLANEKKGFYLSPYNNKEVIAGAGTIALEMLEEIPTLSTLVVSVGGGGLASGIAIAAKSINPDIKVIGVVAANSPVMSTSVVAGRVVRAFQDKTIADGIAGNIEPESITFDFVRELVDDWITVDEEDIVSTVFEFLDNEGMLIEGAASATVAAISRKLLKFGAKEKVGIVICGGNIARNDWREILVQHLVGVTKA
ncbi:MAG: threonine/serine dehydratase [Candidatus Melainabacteria bacterium]|nr:MAG: threonine/serine dehydratase [Candidatus Melainabacteria bacterium]